MSNFDYNSLRDKVVNVYRGAAGTRPDVLHVKIDQIDYVIKDYSVCDGLFGYILGPLLVFREKQALNQLKGIDGVPTVYNCTNRHVLITSYSPAVKASKLETKVNWPIFEHKLHALIEQIHHAGIAHCDLRSPGNILIDNDNSPFIVDFVACIRRTNKYNLPWNFIFKQACQADFSAILKLKHRLEPSSLTSSQKTQMLSDASNGKLFRWFGQSIRSIIKHILSCRKK